MSRRTISLCAAALLVAVTAVDAEESRSRVDADPIAWGEVVNGLQLGLSPPAEFDGPQQAMRVKGPVFDGTALHVSVHLRNVGQSPVRYLPSIWDCLAMGDAGAIPVSKLILKPDEGGDALTVTYQGLNHLRLMDQRRDESESWQETLCKSVPGDQDIQLSAEDAGGLQLEIADGERAWPARVDFTPGKNSQSVWRLTEESNRVPTGTYRMTAVLIVDQPGSEWKGKLTSGPLKVVVRPPATK